jgi:hypothetical protein
MYGTFLYLSAMYMSMRAPIEVEKSAYYSTSQRRIRSSGG